MNATAQRILLTIPETAEQLRVSTQTIRRLIGSGSLPALRVGNQIRIDEAALEVWLAGRARPRW
jgi:excisionase family DNA binding protein